MKIWAIIKDIELFRQTHYFTEGDKLGDREAQTIQHPHTHRFYCTVKISQTHSNRDVEYITLENQVRKLANDPYDGLVGEIRKRNTMSCEDMASFLLTRLSSMYKKRHIVVEITEDGLNGAQVENEI